MNLTPSPLVLLSPDCTRVLRTENGERAQLDDVAAERLRTRQSGAPVSVDALDVELIEAGLLVVDDLSDALVEQRRARTRHRRTSKGQLVVMPTERCDLRCTYCYETFERGGMAPELVAGLQTYLIDAVSRHDRFDLAWFGGEPLLQFTTVRDVSRTFRQAAEARGIDHVISMTTNGHRLTRSRAEQLDGLIDVYQITLDGPRVVHDSRRVNIRGGGTYDRILANVETLLQCSTSEVTLRINMDPSNESESDKIIAWIRDDLRVRFHSFLERIDIHIVATWDASTTSIDGICLRDAGLARGWLSVREAESAMRGSSIEEDLAQTMSTPGSRSCYAASPHSYVIGADGRAFKCSVAFDLDENHVGQLHADGTLTVDEDRERLWIGETSESDPVCGRCSFSTACEGSFCPLVRIQTGQRPCPTEKTFAPQILDRSILHGNARYVSIPTETITTRGGSTR